MFVCLILYNVITCKFLYHVRQDTEQFLHCKDPLCCSLMVVFFFFLFQLTCQIKFYFPRFYFFSLFLTNRRLREKTSHSYVQYFLSELFVIDLQLVSLLPISFLSGLYAKVMVLKYKSNKLYFVIKPSMAL